MVNKIFRIQNRPLNIISPTDINYGYLYNWYVTQDSRLIPTAMQSEGWECVNSFNYGDLVAYLGGDSSTIGGLLKEEGLNYWDTPNIITSNNLGFNVRGAGFREVNAGVTVGYKNLGVNAVYWFDEQVDFDLSRSFILMNSSLALLDTPTNLNSGTSLRLVRPVTIPEQSLPDGMLSNIFYYGSDGKIYRCCKIGTQVWMTDNLAETKWNDNTDIPNIDNDTTWATISTPARCAYNNDELNV